MPYIVYCMVILNSISICFEYFQYVGCAVDFILHIIIFIVWQIAQFSIFVSLLYLIMLRCFRISDSIGVYWKYMHNMQSIIWFQNKFCFSTPIFIIEKIFDIFLSFDSFAKPIFWNNLYKTLLYITISNWIARYLCVPFPFYFLIFFFVVCR